MGISARARAALTRSPGAFSRTAIRKVGVSHAVWKRYLATAITLIDKGTRGSLGPRKRHDGRRRRYFSLALMSRSRQKAGLHTPRNSACYGSAYAECRSPLRVFTRDIYRGDEIVIGARVWWPCAAGERRIVTENALEKLVICDSHSWYYLYTYRDNVARPYTSLRLYYGEYRYFHEVRQHFSLLSLSLRLSLKTLTFSMQISRKFRGREKASW